MIERYKFSFVSSRFLSQKYSSSISFRSFVSSSSSLFMHQSIKIFATKNLKSSIELSDESSDESRDELSNESLNESLIEQSSFKFFSSKNQKRSVERSNESSISSLRSFASLISFTQSDRQSTEQSMSQSMRRLMNQSMRRSTSQSMKQLIRSAIIEFDRKLIVLIMLYTNEIIHKRCDIKWIRESLLNETKQWLLNNRINHFF
jgi:hypothetical protein